MKKFKRTLSFVMAAMVTLIMLYTSITITSALSTISYSFVNNNVGYAQGTISLTATTGTYDLYWADDTKAIDDFSSIATLTFTSNGTKTYTMPAQTAIPDKATKVIAIKKDSTSKNTIYFINNVGWSKVYCHAYQADNTANRNAAWPGVEMTYVAKDSNGNNVYSIELDQAFNEMQFDNGSGGTTNQTVDIPLGTKNAYTISDVNSSSKYNTTNLSYGDDNTFSQLLVADAEAVYNIPSSKLSKTEKLYSFASYSDIQIDSDASAYPYSIQNWENALSFAYEQSTDFVVTSGDNVNSSSATKQEKEWKIYERVLADSQYSNPVYESDGNHELWPGVAAGKTRFVTNSGVDNTTSSVNADKGYYEVTQNGDHYIFLALEGGFYPNQVEEFTTEQLDWAEGLIEKYTGDGHNIFVIEHSPFEKYGAGDNVNNPYYGIPLSDSQSSSLRLKNIFKKYKDVIFLSGHTHIEFGYQYNYSDNKGESCQMIHNSSVGGSRKIINEALDYNYTVSSTEGYIVDVYPDRIVFKGANLYYGQFMPSCTYTVKTSASIAGVDPLPTQPSSSTTSSSSETPSSSTTPSSSETQPSSSTPSYMCGDVDDDNEVTIKDAGQIQKYLVNLVTFNSKQMLVADANGDGDITIKDTTAIQMYIVKLYDHLPPNVINTRTSSVNTIISTSAENPELMAQVKNALNDKYKYASFNQYQTMKKQYNAILNGIVQATDEQYSLLQGYYDSFVTIGGTSIMPTNSVTVYLDNSANWQIPHAYLWSRTVSANNVWPGTPMTRVSGNIYSITFDYDKYQLAIFSNESSSVQTENITLTGDKVLYKLGTLTSGKYAVTSSPYTG